MIEHPDYQKTPTASTLNRLFIETGEGFKWTYFAFLGFYLIIDFFFWSFGPLSQLGVYFGTFMATVMICCVIQTHSGTQVMMTPLQFPGVATFYLGKILILKFLSEQKDLPDSKFARRQQAKRTKR